MKNVKRKERLGKMPNFQVWTPKWVVYSQRWGETLSGGGGERICSKLKSSLQPNLLYGK